MTRSAELWDDGGIARAGGTSLEGAAMPNSLLGVVRDCHGVTDSPFPVFCFFLFTCHGTRPSIH